MEERYKEQAEKHAFVDNLNARGLTVSLGYLFF